MVKVVYGCVTNSLERVKQYVVPRVRDRELILMWNQTSMTVAYNQIISACMNQLVDVLILVHDDLELTDPEGEEKLVAALEKSGVGLVGVAGGYDIAGHGLAWWNAKTVGHQLTDAGMLDFGPREGFVESIEGSIMALTRDVFSYQLFDERFTGFHGYDDIGMTLLHQGWGVYVADVDTHHHTQLGFDNEASHQAWLEADRRFREKWGL